MYKYRFIILCCALSSLIVVSAVKCVKQPVAVHSVAVRAEPKRFAVNTHMPAKREGIVSGSINLSTFSPRRDLIRIDDPRVWWESDNDKHDNEDDHIIHRSMEIPLRRLIELVCKNGGTLKVNEAYRPTGMHIKTSLHKEGRAVDVTCNEFNLNKLAKLCWAAGFDWVYYEGKGGAHIHASVKR